MKLNVKSFEGGGGRYWWKAMDGDGKSEFRSSTRYATKEEADAHLVESREAWAEESEVVERLRRYLRSAESERDEADMDKKAIVEAANHWESEYIGLRRESERRQTEIRAVKEEELAERDKVIDGLRAELDSSYAGIRDAERRIEDMAKHLGKMRDELDWAKKSRESWMQEANDAYDRIDHLESRWANRCKPWTWF